MQEQLRQVPGRAMIFMPLSMLFAYRTVFAVTPTDQFESHISKPQDGSPWRTRSERRTFRLFPTSWFDRNMMTILKCVDTCLLLIPAMSLDTRLLGDRTWWLLFVCVNAHVLFGWAFCCCCSGCGVCLFVLSYSLTILTHSAVLEFQNYTHTSLRKKTFNFMFLCNKQISSALGPNNSFRWSTPHIKSSFWFTWQSCWYLQQFHFLLNSLKPWLLLTSEGPGLQPPAEHCLIIPLA